MLKRILITLTIVSLLGLPLLLAGCEEPSTYHSSSSSETTHTESHTVAE